MQFEKERIIIMLNDMKIKVEVFFIVNLYFLWLLIYGKYFGKKRGFCIFESGYF